MDKSLSKTIGIAAGVAVGMFAVVGGSVAAFLRQNMIESDRRRALDEKRQRRIEEANNRRSSSRVKRRVTGPRVHWQDEDRSVVEGIDNSFKNKVLYELRPNTIGEWVDIMDTLYTKKEGRPPMLYAYAGTNLRALPRDTSVRGWDLDRASVVRL